MTFKSLEITEARISELLASYASDVLARFGAIRHCEEFSLDKLAIIQKQISSPAPPQACRIEALAVAGSLARLEASDQSDLDLIAVAERDTEATHDSAPSEDPFYAWRDDLCQTLKLDSPNPYGVFSRPIARDAILKMAGGANEPYDDVSKRVLFLLESSNVGQKEKYDDILKNILSSYSEDVVVDHRKNFVFLLNDVIRYFRIICVNYQHNKNEHTDGKWPIRNVKLRHSRVVMYFSMVAVLGILSCVKLPEKISLLSKFCEMSPLRRLYICYSISGDTGFYKVAGYYNTFLQLMSNKEVRDGLKDLQYNDRYKSNHFAQLKANSDALASELFRFYKGREGQWDDRFFEYMIV